MIGIILAGHGLLAEGIYQSAQMIIGSQDEVKICSLKVGQSPESFRKELEAAGQDFDSILYLVDLWGGTPFHQVSALIEGKEKRAMITGMNLGLVIEALMGRMACESLEELVSNLVKAGKDAVRSIPEAGSYSKTESKKNVVDTGHIQYVLTRVDSRLLHGQVAAGWTKVCHPDRIIVVSDSVCKNLIRKRLIIQAAPPGVHAHVIPVSKLIQVDKDPRFSKTRALLLFENPETVLRCIKAGVKIEEVNLGSMAYSDGKVSVNKVLAMDKQDVNVLEELIKRNIKIDVRAVPGDANEDILSLIDSAKKQLLEKEVTL